MGISSLVLDIKMKCLTFLIKNMALPYQQTMIGPPRGVYIQVK